MRRITDGDVTARRAVAMFIRAWGLLRAPVANVCDEQNSSIVRRLMIHLNQQPWKLPLSISYVHQDLTHSNTSHSRAQTSIFHSANAGKAAAKHV